MNLSFGNKTKKPLVAKKHDRFNPHVFWKLLLALTLVGFGGVLAYFGWFFLETTKLLNTPAVPQVSENSLKIKTMERNLKEIENYINKKQGIVEEGE